MINWIEDRNETKSAGRRRFRDSGHRKHVLSEKMKALAATALAQRVGYLRLDDFAEAEIFETLPTRRYDANRSIRIKNEVYLIKEGLVQIKHAYHHFMVKYLTKGAMFGEMALIGQTMLGTVAVTGSPGATLAVMETESARRWIETSPVSLLERLGSRLAEIETACYRAGFQLSDSRIASFLLDTAGNGSIVQGFTHEEIGEKLGLYRETVTVILDAMKSDGLIEVGRKRVIILDKQALRVLSDL